MTKDALRPTGWYLPEAAHPYYVLSPHYRIEAISTKGGPVPVDQHSVENFQDEESQKFLKDPEAQKLVKNTKKVEDVKAADYEAIFVIGGVSADSKGERMIPKRKAWFGKYLGADDEASRSMGL